jgi:hypothetical protein
MHITSCNILIFSAGVAVYIPAGMWFAMEFDEASIMWESDICGRKTVMEGMTVMGRTWNDRVYSARARNHFQSASLHVLDVGLDELITKWLNELSVLIVPFTAEEPREGGDPTTSWRMPLDYSASPEIEAVRVSELGVMCAMAREFMHSRVRRTLTIRGLLARNLGRVIQYAQKNLGVSMYQLEKDEVKGQPSRTRRGFQDPQIGQEAVEEAGEVSEEDVPIATRTRGRARGRARAGARTAGAARAGRAGARSAGRGGSAAARYVL